MLQPIQRRHQTGIVTPQNLPHQRQDRCQHVVGLKSASVEPAGEQFEKRSFSSNTHGIASAAASILAASLLIFVNSRALTFNSLLTRRSNSASISSCLLSSSAAASG